MDNGLVAVVLMGILGFAGFFFYTTSQSGRPSDYSPQSGGFQPPGAPAGQATSIPIQVQGGAASPAPAGVQVQEVSIRATNRGYEPASVEVKAGQRVRISFSASGDAGCGRAFIMRKAGISLISKAGSTETAEFTPEKGSYSYQCSMAMFRGELKAV